MLYYGVDLYDISERPQVGQKFFCNDNVEMILEELICIHIIEDTDNSGVSFALLGHCDPKFNTLDYHGIKYYKILGFADSDRI